MAEITNFERVAFGVSDANTIAEHKFRWEWAKGKIQKTDVILIAGCGYGYEIPIYKEREPKEIWAIDKTDAIQYCFHVDYGGLILIDDDLEVCEEFKKLPDDTFNKVISFETIEHLANPNIFLETVVKKLKPRGQFIGSIPINNASPVHKVIYTKEDIKNLLQKYFPDNSYTVWQDPCFVLWDAVKGE